jgi:hypothetical protein
MGKYRIFKGRNTKVLDAIWLGIENDRDLTTINILSKFGKYWIILFKLQSEQQCLT